MQVLSGVVYYIDDILVTGWTREEHATNLQAVLQRIRECGLRLNKSKCQFFTKEMEFWGVTYLQRESSQPRVMSKAF